MKKKNLTASIYNYVRDQNWRVTKNSTFPYLEISFYLLQIFLIWTDGWKNKLDGRPIRKRSSSKWRSHGELYIQVIFLLRSFFFFYHVIDSLRKSVSCTHYSWIGLDPSYDCFDIEDMPHLRPVTINCHMKFSGNTCLNIPQRMLR